MCVTYCKYDACYMLASVGLRGSLYAPWQVGWVRPLCYYSHRQFLSNDSKNFLKAIGHDRKIGLRRAVKKKDLGARLTGFRPKGLNFPCGLAAPRAGHKNFFRKISVNVLNILQHASALYSALAFLSFRIYLL